MTWAQSVLLAGDLNRLRVRPLYGTRDLGHVVLDTDLADEEETLAVVYTPAWAVVYTPDGWIAQLADDAAMGVTPPYDEEELPSN